MLTLPEKVLFALVVAAATAWFARRLLFLVRLVRAGAPDPDERKDQPFARIMSVAADVLGQRRVLRKPMVGAFHLLIVWGFFVFSVNTVNHFAGAFLPGFNLFGGRFPARWYTAVADVFAVLVIAGVLGLAFRRHVLRPPGLTRPSVESVLVFTFIGGAMAAYLVDNAAHIALGWKSHPGSHVVAMALSGVFAGVDATVMRVAAHAAWWVDALSHLVLVALLFIPTKHLHLLAGPFNLYFHRRRPRGRLSMMNLEDEQAESFGVAKIGDFTWKQNLDLLACIECGRCQDYCPTHQSGKALHPKQLIVDLKDHLLAEGKKLITGGAKAVETSLAGNVVDTAAIWACTTCAACVEHCPMGIEHIDKLVDMRRHLVLMESAFPAQADGAFRNMETAGNPWGFAPTARAAWAEGLDVPLMSEKQRADVLFWVGCSGSYDDRCKKISIAMVKILRAAGVDFAILGPEERCNCESARRLGNEYLYQTATQEILETLGRYAFDRILVTCPHCHNTFSNEYPAFGAEYQVVHHSQFIDELCSAGKLPARPADSGGVPVAVHDSCYLARHNGIVDAPRRVLAASGKLPVEPPRHGLKGFCCGAGGGRMWLEETDGEQINRLRARELAATGAGAVAAACPFCVTMLTDGLKAENAGNVEVWDIAEHVAASLES
ncbi:MAG: (Fe-S)-binding protein [Candidatus Hydrogenedentes bacterium]|nr:(Fe-S)-binding protein [Candidatus Hydrogenedentota bacterium]